MSDVHDKIVKRFDLNAKGAHSRRHATASTMAVAGETVSLAARQAHCRQRDVSVHGGYQQKHSSETFAIGKAFSKDKKLLAAAKAKSEY